MALTAGRETREGEEVLEKAEMLLEHVIKKIDSLHIACAIHGGAAYFLTTDDGILKRATPIHSIRIADPIGFIKEVLT